jgi:RNA polymerase sigma-70 factor (ECF subfamily)
LTRDFVAADDLVQECLARALGKATLWQEGTNLRAWLFTILHNQHVNQLRRAAREGVAVALADHEVSLAAPATQTRGLELRDLDRAMDRLPEDQRMTLLLIGVEALSYEEVAQIMDVPVGTVRSRLSRGRTALRQLLAEAESRPVDGFPARITKAAPKLGIPELSGVDA